MLFNELNINRHMVSMYLPASFGVQMNSNRRNRLKIRQFWREIGEKPPQKPKMQQSNSAPKFKPSPCNLLAPIKLL